MAFLVAGFIWLLGSAIAVLCLFASGMSDSQSASADMQRSMKAILFVSWGLAALVISSHWWAAWHWSW